MNLVVLRNRSDFGDGMQRHLIETELTPGLASLGWNVSEFEVPSYLDRTRLLKVLRDRLRTLGPDSVVICSQSLGISVSLLKALNLMHAKLAMISYEPYPEISVDQPLSPSARSRVFIRNQLYSHVDLLLVVSTSQREWLLRCSSPFARISAFPMAIDPGPFTRHRESRRSHIYVSDGGERDFQTLAASLSIAAIPPATTLRITHRAPLNNEKLDAIAKLQLRGINVELLQNASAYELHQLYTDATLVIIPLFPSFQPAGLTALLESMHMQCPTIITDGWARRDYAVDSEAIFAVEPSNPTQLGQLASQLLGIGDLRKSTANHNPQDFGQFTFEESVSTISDEISSLLTHPGLIQ